MPTYSKNRLQIIQLVADIAVTYADDDDAMGALRSVLDLLATLAADATDVADAEDPEPCGC